MENMDQSGNANNGSTPPVNVSVAPEPKIEPKTEPSNQMEGQGMLSPTNQGNQRMMQYGAWGQPLTNQGPPILLNQSPQQLAPTSGTEQITQQQLTAALNQIPTQAANMGVPAMNNPNLNNLGPMFLVDGQLVNQTGQLIQAANFPVLQQQNQFLGAQVSAAQQIDVKPLILPTLPNPAQDPGVPSNPAQSFIIPLLSNKNTPPHVTPAPTENQGTGSIGAAASTASAQALAAYEALAGKVARASNMITPDATRYKELEAMQVRVLAKNFSPVDPRNITDFMNFHQIPTWKSVIIQEKVKVWAQKSADLIRQALLLEIQGEMLHLKGRRDLVAKDVHLNDGKLFGMLAQARTSLGL